MVDLTKPDPPQRDNEAWYNESDVESMKALLNNNLYALRIAFMAPLPDLTQEWSGS